MLRTHITVESQATGGTVCENARRAKAMWSLPSIGFVEVSTGPCYTTQIERTKGELGVYTPTQRGQF